MIGIISTLLIILFVAVCALLILFVLLQDDQGEGLGGLFGGSSGSPFGGATNNVLVRITTVLGVSFMVGSLVVAFIVKSPDASNVRGEARRMSAEEQNGQDWWEAEAAVDTAEGETLIIPQN